jgi:regulator of replication initiation timing
MTPEVKEKIKGKTTQEITQMIKTKEITLPSDEKERNEFLVYASKKPEERDPPTEKPAESKPVAPVAPVEGTGKDNKGSIADDTSGQKWFERLGYASAEEAETSHKKMFDLNKQLQANIDAINAREGRRGTELKNLKDENARIRKELDELKTKSTPVLTKPEKPKRPNPKDFDDGVLDQKYMEAREVFDIENDKYTDDLIAYERYENQKLIDSLRPKQAEVVVEPTEEVSAWDRIFDTEIPEFQKRYGVETKASIRQISDNLNKAQGKTTNDPNEIARAQAFLDTVPSKDMENYKKIKELVMKTYDFKDSALPSKYAKGLEGAAVDHEMLGEGKPFNIVKPSSLTPDEEKRLREEQQRKNGSVVDAIPGHLNASGDGSPAVLNTPEEKVKRYRDLVAAFNTAMRLGYNQKEEFKKTPEFAEMNKLAVDLKLRPIV